MAKEKKETLIPKQRSVGTTTMAATDGNKSISERLDKLEAAIQKLRTMGYQC